MAWNFALSAPHRLEALLRDAGFRDVAVRREIRQVPFDSLDDYWAAMEAGAGLSGAAYRALARVTSAVRGRHGRMWGDRELLAPIAAGIACNEHGAEVIGRLIEPYLHEAAAREGYRALPAAAAPVVMNTKGAPASGKSAS